MAIIDIVLASLLLFGLVRGFMKGLFVEVASLVALIAGIYGAIHFSGYAAGYLAEKTDWEKNYIDIVAFAVTFVIIVLAITLAGKALTKLANFAALGILNKLLGAVFGALKIGLILSILLIVFENMNDTVPFTKEEDLGDAVLYKPVKQLAPMLFPSILTKGKNNDPLNLFNDTENEGH